MGYIALNGAKSTLAGSLGIGDLSVAVQAGDGAKFAVGSDFTYLVLQDDAGHREVIKQTARSSDTLTIVRAQDGTTERAWNVGDIIECRPVKAAMALHAQLSALAATDGAGLIGFKFDDTDAVARTLLERGFEICSPKDWGATGTGASHDDLDAIQKAITYCQNNLVALDLRNNDPSQYWFLDGGGLSITKPVVIIGSGSHNSQLRAVGLTAGQYALDVDGTAYGTFENMRLFGFSVYAGSGDAIRLKNVSQSILSDISWATCRHGIVIQGTRGFGNEYHKVRNGGATGTSVLFNGFTGGGQHNFTGSCTLGGANGVSVDSTSDVDALNFYGANFEQCSTYGININGTCYGLGVFGGRFEGGNSHDIVIQPGSGKLARGIVIQGVRFDSSDSGGTDRIVLGGGAGTVRGFDISANHVSHSTNAFSGNFVYLNGDGESGSITGNTLAGSTCSITNAQRTGVRIENNEKRDNSGTITKFTDYFGTVAIALKANTEFTLTDNSGSTLTMTIAAGAYARNNAVYLFKARIQYPSGLSGDTNPAQFTGLPAAPLAGSQGQGYAGCSVAFTDAGIDIGVLMGVNTTTGLKFYNRLTGAVLKNEDLSGKQIFLHGQIVAA